LLDLYAAAELEAKLLLVDEKRAAASPSTVAWN
jgi:hypothetical protein